MRFQELLEAVGGEPLFETGLLLAGDVDPKDVRRQLSRWVAAGKIYRLRRGVYALAPPYERARPHPFVVANHLARASYVSLQSALAHHGLIPEYVPIVTSVTTGRPRELDTPLGGFLFRHIRRELFFGFQPAVLANGQTAFLASPEKALLDQVYLEPGADDASYLRALRLRNLDRLEIPMLVAMADRARSLKLKRAAAIVAAMAEQEMALYETLPGSDG